MKTFRMLAILVAVLCLLVMSACSGNGGTSSTGGAGSSGGSSSSDGKSGGNNDKKIDLTIAYWTGVDNMKGVTEKAIEIFKQKYPNATVKINEIPHDNYWTKITASMSGGAGSDVVLMNGPNFAKFATLGLLADPQPYLDEDGYDMSVFPPGITDLYKYKGDYYGIPSTEGAVALYYNKKLFDEKNIPYPDESWTWEDIEKYGKQLTNKSKKIYGYAFDEKAPQTSLYAWIHQDGGFVINDDWTKSGFGTPEATKALAFAKKLVDEGISPSPKVALQTLPKQLFASGRIAMLPSGTWNVRPFEKALKDDLGIAVLPHDKKRGYLLHGSAFVINKNSKYPKAAWELAEIFGSKQIQDIMAKTGTQFPTNINSVGTYLKAYPNLNLEAFKKGLAHTGPYPVSVNTQQWIDMLMEQFDNMLLGKMSPEEASQNIAEQMNAILAKEQ